MNASKRGNLRDAFLVKQCTRKSNLLPRGERCAGHSRRKLCPNCKTVSYLALGHIFQKRKVSSPAPVTMLDPSGLTASCRTREVCPVKAATFLSVGYFHTIISFPLYPCVVTSSFVDRDQARTAMTDPCSHPPLLRVHCAEETRPLP
eukprot:scaffold137_cov398-Prasinococcus_capsulatus_cf.AAC.24